MVQDILVGNFRVGRELNGRVPNCRCGCGMVRIERRSIMRLVVANAESVAHDQELICRSVQPGFDVKSHICHALRLKVGREARNLVW